MRLVLLFLFQENDVNDVCVSFGVFCLFWNNISSFHNGWMDE